MRKMRQGNVIMTVYMGVCVCVCVCVCVRMCPYPLTTLDDVAKEASLRRWLLNSGQVVEGGASFENSMQ